MPSKTPSIVSQAHAARAKLAALQADAERLAADAAQALAAFQRDPSPETATAQMVAAQCALNAAETAERARVDTEPLFASEARELALTELAELTERHSHAAHAARIEPLIAAVLDAEATVRRSVAALNAATAEQRSVALRASQLAAKVGTATTLRGVEESAAIDQIRSALVAKYGPNDPPVDSWIRFEPSLAALSKKASA